MSTREIKFRVWQPHKNKMLSWDELQDWGMSDFNFPGSQAVFMQFTGLKDKNGKEIYEGDILESEADTKLELAGNRYEVKYEAEYAGFYPFIDCDYGACSYYSYPLKVIGNICENPELTKN